LPQNRAEKAPGSLDCPKPLEKIWFVINGPGLTFSKIIKIINKNKKFLLGEKL